MLLKEASTEKRLSSSWVDEDALTIDTWKDKTGSSWELELTDGAGHGWSGTMTGLETIVELLLLLLLLLLLRLLLLLILILVSLLTPVSFVVSGGTSLMSALEVRVATSTLDGMGLLLVVLVTGVAIAGVCGWWKLE